MVEGVFIPTKPCCFQKREWLKSHLLLTTLIEDKYILHIINKIVSMIGSLKDLVYTYYEYKHDIYHVFNTFIIEDHPRSGI
jgi:hypothetical protein